MKIRTILVCLTTPDNAETLARVAASLARRFDAHLIGLHTIEALILYPGIAMHVPGPAFSSFNESQMEQSGAIEKIFNQHTHAESFVSEWRLLKSESKTAADRIIESARSVDLVVVAQEENETDRPDQHHIQTRIIKESGRPVLVVPNGYTGDCPAKNVVVGWGSTREAARAAHDALTLMDDGATAHIVRIAGGQDDDLRDFSSMELAAGYARHGIQTKIIHRETAAGSSVSEMLMKEAFEIGADMIVSGAFGHSWVYDFVIGAATRDLLRKAKIPVLFAK